MTRGDVMVQILHEVTGKSKEFAREIFELSLRDCPGHKFNEEMSDKEADELLNGLRKEKEGILNWLLRGNLEFQLKHLLPPRGLS